ncbi:MAG: prepilin-type N-terminal cleavage/methylation domain-containing protein [Candidatus Gracilibacteria bacterium]
MQIFSSVKKHSAFTLTELIVVITILSILSVIGFVVMSHESSVARDGKRISDIKTLSESARITSAQLRLLPTPIADSVSLSVSGSFIGYQGFMNTTLVNPLGYGSDKIFDPKDNIPYTYRVNQHYDSAQFMAYLENPRFERSIEIAKQSLPSTLGDLANIGSFSNFGDTLSASLREATEGTMEGMRVSQAYAGDTMYPFDTAYALDSSSIDLSKRYPYSAGDRLGIFLSKGSKQPLQNGVSGTGSRDISLSDASTLDIIVGSQGADEYVSTDISTGSLNALKNGSFDEKSLLGMNSGSSGSNGGSVPQTPENLQTTGGSGSISLTWDYVTGATQYTLAWSTSLSGTYTEIINISNTGYTHTGRTNDVTTFYKVKAINSHGESIYSGIIQAYAHIPCIDDLSDAEVIQLNNLTNVTYDKGTWCTQTNINISNKSLSTFPIAITKLRELQYLSGGSNNFTSLPEEFGNLRKLRTIELQRSSIASAFNSLPDSVGNLDQLEYLNLTGYPLNSLPTTLSGMTNLKDLRITDTRFNSFPEIITSLNLLERLSIGGPSSGGAYLNNIPSSIDNLVNLKHLDIAYGSFTSLPNTFGNLINLEYLNLNGHHMNSAPSNQLITLTNLNFLNLSGYMGQYPSQLFTYYTWSSPSTWNDYGANLRIRSIGDSMTPIQITRINP